MVKKVKKAWAKFIGKLRPSKQKTQEAPAEHALLPSEHIERYKASVLTLSGTGEDRWVPPEEHRLLPSEHIARYNASVIALNGTGAP